MAPRARLSVGVIALLGGCAAYAGSAAVTSMVMFAVPSARVAPGDGSESREARTRRDTDAAAALREATRDALTAAQASDDLRLQRRAAAMVRQLAATQRDALDLPAVESVLARLAATPCPGLADVGATRAALGEDGRAGDALLRAARECRSSAAAVAAVPPLRAAGRCGDAIDGVRDAWPYVDRQHPGAEVVMLDAVALCSDDLSLRRNLSFVPDATIDGYFALRVARELDARDAALRAEANARAQEAEDRAREATWRCESECDAAISSCETSCAGAPSCQARCTTIGHTCRASCGAP